MKTTNHKVNQSDSRPNSLSSTSQDCLYLHDIAVIPTARGRGYSQLLMRYLLKYSGLANLRWLDLVAVQSSSNRWEQMGFQSTGSAPESYGHGAVSMSLQIQHHIDGFTVRAAEGKDLEAVLELVSHEGAFAVSEDIKFYEPSELLDFVLDPTWIIGVLCVPSGEVVGFASAHRMSWHWTLMDNFFISPMIRGRGAGQHLYYWLSSMLHVWRSKYVTTLVDPEDLPVLDFLARQGWKTEKTYLWADFAPEW